jgi:hypothetical protein
MKAKSVVDVVLGEAGGRTRTERFADMLGIASVIANRAELTGATWDSIVSAKKQFNAFNKALPPGAIAYKDLAQQAIDQVMAQGPIHNATFFATPAAAHRLPGGLARVTQTKKGHQYFSDPRNRAIATANGYVAPNRSKAKALSSLPDQTSAVPYSRVEAASKSPFGKHLADVNSRLGGAAARNSFALGLPSTPSNFLGRPAQVASNSFSRPAALTGAPNGMHVSGMLNRAGSLPDTRGWTSSGVDARSLTPSAQSIGRTVGASLGRGFMGGLGVTAPQPGQRLARSPEQMTRDMVSADPFSRNTNDPIGLGRYSTTIRDAIASQEYAPDMSSVAAAKDWGAKQSLEMATNPKTFDNVTSEEAKGVIDTAKKDAALSYARDERQDKKPNAAFDVLSGTEKLGTPETSTPTNALASSFASGIARSIMRATVETPVAPEVAATEVAPTRTVRTVQRQQPARRTVQRRTPAQITVTRPNNALGLGRFSVGSGLKGINAAMGGPKGATGFSRSMPGVSVTSRGSNMGTITRNDKFGTTTFRDPSGNVTGVHYDEGRASRLGSVLGGIFGGGGSSSSGGGKSTGGSGSGKSSGGGRSIGASKRGADA